MIKFTQARKKIYTEHSQSIINEIFNLLLIDPFSTFKLTKPWVWFFTVYIVCCESYSLDITIADA